MKFTRSRYPDRAKYSSPCWKLTGRWVRADADWNTRFPFGVSLGVTGPGFFRLCLDVNAPLGEPNGLYLTGPRRNYMIGLLAWHTEKVTHVTTSPRGRRIACTKHVWCWPRLERGQSWDWKRSEGSDRWRWLVIHPNDSWERWARAHQEEAAAAERRRAEHAARAAARKAADEQGT